MAAFTLELYTRGIIAGILCEQKRSKERGQVGWACKLEEKKTENKAGLRRFRGRVRETQLHHLRHSLLEAAHQAWLTQVHSASLKLLIK